MQKTRINPSIHQELLESAPNAAAKGQAQYFTPAAWARLLGAPLPKYRPVITDLTCGNGQLLSGTAGENYETRHILGCDIDPHVDDAGRALPWSAAFLDKRVAADITKFHSLLREVNFTADLFVLNPPWDLHWHRDRLKDLADSSCRAAADAFAAHDGRTSRDNIDSTVATLCLALDLSSTVGEGMLIANEATLQRLIFAPAAPHRALVNHIWAHMAIDGNICGPKSGSNAVSGPDAVSGFKTGVIWFARSPQSGYPKHYAVSSKEDAEYAVQSLRHNRITHRRGADLLKGMPPANSGKAWQAAREEWQTITGQRKAAEWNIMLDMNGVIITDLSLFDQQSGRIPKAELSRLFALTGKHPMQLVIQKAQRKELELATFGEDGKPSRWKVAPSVQQAVRLAIKEYDAVRAPLRPLNKIQRLGYLDEQDEIKCERSLGSGYTVGQSYRIRTLTISVRRDGEKMNLSGELDEVEWTGSELCIYIRDNDGVERAFMEARLRGKDVKLSLPDADPDEEIGPDDAVKIDYTLQQLIEHFTIPEVPDVASLNPELFLKNVDMLHEIERIIA